MDWLIPGGLFAEHALVGIVAALDTVWPAAKLIEEAVGRTDPCG